jgi:RNA 2',3'-cyclic 3'-phosphodiesterase
MIRAFIAVQIDPKTVQKILETIEQLKLRVPDIRWIPPSNLHLTLKFLGDIDSAKVDPVVQALQLHLHLFSRFIINAKGLGVFPDVKWPRVLWVGLEGNRLAELASTVETALQSLGFPREKRGFKPHLTVGRWRQSDKSPAKLGEKLGKWQSQEFGETEVSEIILFQSLLKSDGAIHRPLKNMALCDEPLN